MHITDYIILQNNKKNFYHDRKWSGRGIFLLFISEHALLNENILINHLESPCLDCFSPCVLISHIVIDKSKIVNLGWVAKQVKTRLVVF